MTTVHFTGDQMMALLEFLENQAESGYTLEEIIESIKDGSATTEAQLTDGRYFSRGANESISQ